MDTKKMAQIFAIQAEIEGMKVGNSERLANGQSPLYDHSMFLYAAERLRALAASDDNDTKKKAEASDRLLREEIEETREALMHINVNLAEVDPIKFSASFFGGCITCDEDIRLLLAENFVRNSKDFLSNRIDILLDKLFFNK